MPLLLLAFGVAGAVARPHRLPAWVTAACCVVVALAVGVVAWGDVGPVLTPLRDPVLFLVFAVPLAALLDEVGVFGAAAHRLGGRHLCLGLWVLGAVVVALLNLDAAVVLLTPLYVRVARRSGVDPLALGVQPALLACLSSSALPVSNLTNLLAVEARGTSTGLFPAALGLPTVVATAVGYGAWRFAFRSCQLTPRVAPAPVTAERRAVRIGGATAGVLVLGFTVGRAVGIEPWVVALVTVVALAGLTRSAPWRSVPVGTVVLVAALAVLADAAARSVDLGGLLGSGTGPLGLARITLVGAVGANLANNLPVFLVGLPALPAGHGPLFAWLLGVNAGPTLLVTGSLSGLLWLDAVRAEGLDAGPSDYLRAGVRVGLPALLAATVVASLLLG